jgi:predicted ATPase
MIADGLARYRAAGAALSLPLFLGSLASVEAAAGNRHASIRLLAEAQEAGRAGEEHWFSPEIHRLSGEATRALNGDLVAAERAFRAALALAREQGAKLWELRAATSLTRLLRTGDKGAAARDDLWAIYRYFSEELSDPDLLEAKAVLDPVE